MFLQFVYITVSVIVSKAFIGEFLFRVALRYPGFERRDVFSMFCLCCNMEWEVLVYGYQVIVKYVLSAINTFRMSAMRMGLGIAVLRGQRDTRMVLTCSATSHFLVCEYLGRTASSQE